jgi:streptogramin lyase
VSDFGNASNQEIRRFDDNGAPIPPVPFINTGGGGAEGTQCRTVGGITELIVANNTGRINVYNRATGTLLRTFLIAGGQTIAAISLSLDGSSLYVADYGALKIFKVDPSLGDLTGTLVVNATASIATNASHDLVVGPDGNIYADHFSLSTGVVRYDANLTPGSLTQFIPNGDHGLTNASGLGFVGATLYVSNFNAANSLVNVYGDGSANPSNTFIATIPFPANSRPLGIAGRTNGTILVAEFGADAVALITRTGTNTFTLNAQFIPTPTAGTQPKYVSNPEGCRAPPVGRGCSANPLTFLAGTWQFSIHGFAPQFLPFASAGNFTASVNAAGRGILSVTSTSSWFGNITRQEVDAGTFQVAPDCLSGSLVFNLSSKPLTFDFWVSGDGNTLRLVSTVNGYDLRGIATFGGNFACPANPLTSLSGRWIFSSEGFSPFPQAFAAAGQFLASIGPRGPTLAITSTSDLGFSLTRQEVDAGTYQINPGCASGTLTFNLSSNPLTFDFWFTGAGRSMYLINTTSGSVVWGSANQ